MDVPAAFNTINHAILINTLRWWFEVDGNALTWVAEFLGNWRPVLYVGKTESDNTALQFGVPHGSVLDQSVCVCSIWGRRRGRNLETHQDSSPTVHWRHAGLLQRIITWWCSCNNLFASKLNCRHLRLVWRQNSKRLQLNTDKTKLSGTVSQLHHLASKSSFIQIRVRRYLGTDCEPHPHHCKVNRCWSVVVDQHWSNSRSN